MKVGSGLFGRSPTLDVDEFVDDLLLTSFYSHCVISLYIRFNKVRPARGQGLGVDGGEVVGKYSFHFILRIYYFFRY